MIFETYDKGWDKLISLINNGNKIILYRRINIVSKTNNLIVLYRKDFDDYHVFPIKDGVFNKLKTGDGMLWGKIRVNPNLNSEMILYVNIFDELFTLSSGIRIDKDDIENVGSYILKEMI